MLKLRLWLAYLVILFKRKKRYFLLFGVVFLVAFLFFSTFKNELFKEKIAEGIVGTHEPRDLPDNVLNLISASLVNIDNTGAPKPGLSDSWEVSEDGKVYKFKLKNGILWSDGTAVKASEIAIAIPDVEIKALDDWTLEFKIADAFSPFPTLLKKPILKKGTFENTNKNPKPMGVGPYQIITLRKDGPFVKQLNLRSKDQKLPEVKIRFYPSEKIAKNALRLGEFQALIGSNEPEEFLGDKSFKISSRTNFNQLVTIFYDTSNPILADENLRLALSYGAPQIPGEVEAKSPLSPRSWAFNDKVKDYIDNPVQAKASLGRVQKGKDETIILTATSSLQNIGNKVVEAWKASGIKAVLRVESGIPQNFQALLITQNIPADPDQYSLWHSTQGATNISKISSPRIDKDLEDGRKSNNLEERKQKYQDFQKVLMDESPATFLYFPKLNLVYLKKVENSLNKILEIQLRNYN